VRLRFANQSLSKSARDCFEPCGVSHGKVKEIFAKIMAVLVLASAGACFILTLRVADSDMPTGNAVLLIMLLGLTGILFIFIGVLLLRDH